jgi:hypothetical protein
MAEALVFEPLGLELSTYRILGVADRSRVAVGYRSDGAEVDGGGWHAYPEQTAASLWTTPTEYAAFVIDVMRSYGDGTGVVLDRATAQLLLDPDFAVGFGVSREEGGIAIAHAGANEGYRCEFVAVPHLGEGVIVMTNSDFGEELDSSVINAVAGELGWPWASNTIDKGLFPHGLFHHGLLHPVPLGLIVAAGLAAWLVIRRGRRRSQHRS